MGGDSARRGDRAAPRGRFDFATDLSLESEDVSAFSQTPFWLGRARVGSHFSQSHIRRALKGCFASTPERRNSETAAAPPRDLPVPTPRAHPDPEAPGAAARVALD